MSVSPASPPPVIDGLVYLSDGDPAPLRDGGVTAANITVTDMFWDMERTFEALGEWQRRVAAPGSGWRLVRSATDIVTAQAEGTTGLIMGWQSIEPFGSRLERVAAFHAMGLRMAQLTYNEASLAGDGCLEERGAGLTRFGRRLVAEMNRVGIGIDLSHCGDRTALEAARASTRPVFLTHANAKAVDARVRNKLDETILAVAATGGVIGVSIHGFMNWDGTPEHPPSLANFVRHARHVADLVGVDHLGIGTDFSALRDDATAQRVLDMSKNSYPETGGIFAAAFGNASAGRYPPETPTPRQFPRILQALRDGGFSADEVGAIGGGNFLRAFREVWG
ncbi:MAG: membrane dipeptidase [Burkholderiales bacterium]|nr:membrane dipeptidase [Burkholderiales bacterium]